MIATVASADMRTAARAPSVTFTASAIAPHWAAAARTASASAPRGGTSSHVTVSAAPSAVIAPS